MLPFLLTKLKFILRSSSLLDNPTSSCLFLGSWPPPPQTRKEIHLLGFEQQSGFKCYGMLLAFYGSAFDTIKKKKKYFFLADSHKLSYFFF